MGLFSFLKNAGKAHASTPTQADLTKELTDMGLNQDGISVSINDDAVAITGEAQTQEMLEKMVLALGNLHGIAKVETNVAVADAAKEAVFYTVVAGDTLSKIAKKQYDDAGRYNDIFEANKPMLSHPDKIYPGQVLRIPQ